MKIQNIIRQLILFLFIAIVVVAYASCAKDNAPPDQSAVENNTEENLQESKDTERLYADVPQEDFGGYEFTILTRTLNDPDWTDWNHRDIYAESQNGELINDAVYQRNSVIEEKYNITIKEVVLTDVMAPIRKLTKAGDNVYDAFFPHLNEFVTLSQEGVLYDLFQVPYIDLTQPWWNQGCVRDLSVGNSLYAVQGDITIIDNDATSAMIFNKQMLTDFGLESPYEIVNRGEWTLSVLQEMIKGVSMDLNGDGRIYMLDDRMGLIAQADAILAFYYGSGEKIARKDSDDYPYLTFANERSFNVLQTITDLMADTDNVVNLHTYMNKFPIYEEQANMFSENRALFSWIRMRVVEKLRFMDTDFGILPVPKYESSQQQYWSQINSHTSSTLAIPTSNNELERTGMILESLAAESKYTLQPAYYELNLVGKFARDAESIEMLDIIFSTTMYDIGEVYKFGNFFDTIIWNYKTAASAYEKNEVKIQKEIDKVITAYEKLK